MKNTLIQRHSNWASDANGIVEDFLNATGKSIPQTIGLNVQGAKKFIALKDLSLEVYTNPPVFRAPSQLFQVIQVKKGDVIIGRKQRAAIHIILQLPTQTDWIRHGDLYAQDVKEFSPMAATTNKTTNYSSTTILPV